MIQSALTEPQLELLRAATPGWHDSLHLNHAGASPMSMASLAAIREHMELESRLGAMDAAQIVTAKIAQVRSDAARLFNADPDEVALLASGSAAFGAVWAALPPLRAGDRILVGRQEWGGNLVSYLRSAARAGARVEMLPCLPDGRVDVEAATAMLDERVRWLSLTWLPANGGLINDAAALGRLARAAGVPYFIDAGQAVGQLPVDVSVLGCDVLKSAARKHLRGPRGTALLYVRKSFVGRLEPSWVDVQSAPWFDELRPDARRFETAEQSVALWLGPRIRRRSDREARTGSGQIVARATCVGSGRHRTRREHRGSIGFGELHRRRPIGAGRQSCACSRRGPRRRQWRDLYTVGHAGSRPDRHRSRVGLLSE